MLVRAAIAGLGRWGRRLVDSVQAGEGQVSQSIRFVRGWTRTAEASRDFARARGFDLAADFESLLADSSIDAIVLATPHSQHWSQVVACAQAGKAVYVEKPLALTLAQAMTAVEACRTAGVTLAVGHNRRFVPAMLALSDRVRQGEFGQLLHVEGNFSGPFGLEYQASAWRAHQSEAPGGGLTLMGVHIIDAMIALMGPVASVSALSLRQVLSIDLDDTSAGTFRFASGASGYMSTLTATARLWRLQVFGTIGWAHVLDNDILETCRIGGEVQRQILPGHDAERVALEHFARAVTGEAAFPVDIEHVLNGIATLEAFVRSSRQDGVLVTLAAKESSCCR